MPSSLVLTFNSDRKKISNLLDSDPAPEAIRSLQNYLHALAIGCEHAEISVQTNDSEAPVAAAQTFTCAAVVEDDTVTIGPITLTAKDAPDASSEFDSSGDDSETAASLAATINAHPTLGEVVYASANAAVVTVTCKTRGRVGNFIPTSSSNGTRLDVGASTLTGGTGGATSDERTYNLR